MPYIPEERREQTSSLCPSQQPDNAGELNFSITELILYYIMRNGNPKYQDYNDVIGVLDLISKELFLRAVTPYEKIKIKQNGDLMAYDRLIRRIEDLELIIELSQLKKEVANNDNTTTG